MSIQNDKLMNLADGKLLYDDLRRRVNSVDNQVVIGDDQPQDENNKLWVDTNETGTDIQVPTYSEFNTQITRLDSVVNNKEDKPDLIATYTITGNNTATCDKTIEEIGQAYDSGKNIEAIITLDGQQLKAQILALAQGGRYLFFVGATIIFEGVSYIGLAHSSMSETISVLHSEPMLSVNGVYTALNQKIIQLAAPTANTDAATKGYVDTALTTKEDKPGLEVTFSVIVSKQIVQPGEDPYTVTCDTTDSDIVNAHDNGEKIRAIADIAGMRVELPLYMIETVPNVGSVIMFMGRSIDLYSVGSGGLSNVGFSDVILVKASFMGQQDWRIQFQNPTDIQINGTSIVSNGVANIPKASSGGDLGVVKTNTSYGITSRSDGTLATVTASEAKIKAGTNAYDCIQPTNQHISAFYGLAKAAGDATQSASSNAVGTYTPEAKTAIQNMLGITRIDDTAGIGDTDVTYSADKLATDHSSLLNAINSKSALILTSSGSPSTLNKTFSEIAQAHAENKPIYLVSEQTTQGADWSEDNRVYEIVYDIYAYEENGEDPIYEVVTFNGTTQEVYAASSLSGYPTFKEVFNGWVKDVNIYNKSIVNAQGVAKIPIVKEGQDNYGVCSVQQTYGMSASNGKIYPYKAQDSDLKVGTHEYRPIVPYNQHSAVFYGLAKAAGDSTQSASANAVGTYTDEAKASIQSMLGVDSMLAPVESDLTSASQAYAIGDVFSANGKLYKATSAIAVGDLIVPDTNCVETSVAESAVHDVKVDGSSVVSNGVATIPTATGSVAGVVIVNPTYGHYVTNRNIVIQPPSDSQIKSGSWPYIAVTPSQQDKAVFYGLSKAAGVDLKEATVTYGTYPATALTAIQSMLGIHNVEVVRLA